MLFKQRKPKKFSYKPRNSDGNEERDIASKWRAIRDEKKSSSNKNKSLIFWLIGLGMVIVIWFILNNYQN